MAVDYVIHPAELSPAGEADYRDHARTYYAFLHILRWTLGHLVLVLGSIYCFAIANQPLLGTAVLALAFVVAVWGIATTPNVAHRQVGGPAERLSDLMRPHSAH